MLKNKLSAAQSSQQDFDLPFIVQSNLSWLDRLSLPIQTVFMKQLYAHGVFNEVMNTYKIRWFKRKRIKTEHVGIWGWNTWCGVHALTPLTPLKIHRILQQTISTGFENCETDTGLLPHAVLHDQGIFASKIEHKCYGGMHGEGYNLDNILCWAKMAMEYTLYTNDFAWLHPLLPTILTTVDYILKHFREKYNPSLIYTGIEGDWTECTAWELDNANVNANMIRTLELLIICLTNPTNMKDPQDMRVEKYTEIRNEMIKAFNLPYSEGGFWHPEIGHYIHGNNGTGSIIHGDQYFEATANYFAMLWQIAPPAYRKKIWAFIDAHPTIEMPYPVLTNFQPRTGTRREDYGNTVTNGDVWMVLGGHAAAARLQDGYITQGTQMFQAIQEYEEREGVFHNSIYPKTKKVNDSWDPEIGNYGAGYAVFLLGLLGLRLSSQGIEFNITPLEGLEHLHTTLMLFDNPATLYIQFVRDSNGESDPQITLIRGKHEQTTIPDEKEVIYSGKSLKFMIPRE